MRAPYARWLVAALALALATAGSAVAVVPSDPIARIIGTGNPGSTGDNGPAILAQLAAPQGVAADAQGRIYVADGANGKIRRTELNGNITTVTSGLGEPADVAVDAQGRVYVAGASDNIVYQVVNGVRTPFAGTGVAGSTGDGGAAIFAQVNEPRGVAVDAAGNVYIAESGGERIRRVGTDGVIQTFAGTGATGFSGDGGLATSAMLFGPRDVVAAPDGSIIVVDTGNSSVRRIDANGVIRTIAGNGGSSGGSACPLAPVDAGATSLDFPHQAAVDGGGNVYIASQGCVTKVVGGTIRRIAGNGASTGDSGDGGPAVSALVQPSGVAIDPSGSLIIAAGLDNKVRRVLNVAPTASFTATTPAPLTVATDAAASSSGQAGEALGAISWQFGDGSVAEGATAGHVYAAAGTYTVTLTVRDDSGISAATTRAVAVAAPPPPPPPPPPPLAITLTRSSIGGAYRAGKLRAALTLKGTASGPGSTTVRLRRRSGPRAIGLVKTAALPLTLAGAGAFTARLALPRRLAPGRYAIALDTKAIAGAAGSVAIAQPPAGIARRAFVSGVQNGPAATAFPRLTRRLYCTFDFAVLPLPGPRHAITTQWRAPSGPFGRVTKPRSPRVTGLVASPAGLPSGRYVCTLRSGTVALSSVRALIR